jgi:hypothetical protein
MKFYETTADEYITTLTKYNLHSELKILYENNFPKTLQNFENIIVYGPVGSGKYSQVLEILKMYSPSQLKYEKKITVQSDKNSYTFHISDIYYEVDMSFLGCNSKNLWHDIFCQIVDIISVKQEKIGIILCKNFHMIHSELLEIFYSYIQQYNANHMNISVKFIILTEHISFLPKNILNSFAVLNIKKPNKLTYKEMVEKNIRKGVQDTHFLKRISGNQSRLTDATKNIIENIDTNTLINIKELQSFSLIKTEEEIPQDIFNIICDKIISEISCSQQMNFTTFRDSLYDILIYNLDVIECIWYILSHFILSSDLTSNDISDILQKTYTFLKYFNNNYRPIYHLENIMFYLITKLNKYNGTNDKKKGISCSQHPRK